MIIKNEPLPNLNDNQQAWLLMKISEQTPLAKLYENGDNPRVSWLYDSTLLEDVKEEGPLLTNITDTSLLTDFCQTPELWSAFLIYTSDQVTEEQLLQHLRNLLIVRFNEEDTGILNYFDPKVASFFFNMPDHQLSQWLGTIDLISWWGGDYIEVESHQQKLHMVINPLPLAQREPLPEKPMLTKEQEELLLQCQEQQYLKQWSLNVNIPFLSAWQYYQEGLQQGFSDEDLENYIKQRASKVEKMLRQNFFPDITTIQ